MGNLDLETLRRKLNELKDPSLKKSKFVSKLWKPKPGIVRFLKEKDREDPFYELWFHYGIGKGQSILCPRLNTGKQKCPICEFAFDLKKNSGDQNQQMFKDLMPRQRWFALMVDRTDSMNPLYWGFGKTIYQKLLESLLSEDYGDFLDPLKGLDTEVKVSEKKAGPQVQKQNSNQFTSYDIVFKRKESPLTSTPEQLEKLYDAITPITEIYKPLTTGEIQARFNDWINMTDKDGEELDLKKDKEEVTDAQESSDEGFTDLEKAFRSL